MARILSLMPRIYFKDPESIATLEAFQDDLAFSLDYAPDKIIAAAREATCLLCPAPYPDIPEKVINGLPNLKLIQVIGAGYDKIDIAAAARAGIPVANTPGLNTSAVAELALAAIIALQRGIAYGDKEIKAGRYQQGREIIFERGTSEVGGSRWGIVGLGRIGARLAEMGRFLGAEVAYYSRRRKAPEEESRLGVVFRPFEELLAQSDVVIVCVALTGETKGMIGRREMAMMKPGAILVNVARGGIVDDAALAEALARGHLGGAVLDTFETEPLPADHPLLRLPPEKLDRLLLTPHLGGTTTQAMNRMLKYALDNCRRVIRGEKPLSVVNGVA
jgi:phosphoglycerate dehydrogenase-like enzyme